MSHHDKHDHDSTRAREAAFDQGPPRTPQLEPDDYLLEYQLASTIDPNPNPWQVLATIAVDPTNETWAVDRLAVNVLASVGAIRLSVVDRFPGVDHAIPESAATVVTWARALNPAYPSNAFTFAGGYVGSGGPAILAVGFETAGLKGGGAAISVSHWFNPEATPVNLARSGGSVTLLAVTGVYSGLCFTATSNEHYAP